MYKPFKDPFENPFKDPFGDPSEDLSRSKIGVIQKEKPGNYQNVNSILLEETKQGEKEDISVNVLKEASQKETEEKVRNELKMENWWLQEEWQKKGLPKEQLTINFTKGKTELYNYSQKLEERHIKELEIAFSIFESISDGKYLNELKYILINNVSEKNENSGEPKYGRRQENIHSIVLNPEALSFEPHRIKDSSVFLGTLIHEMGHIVAPDMIVEWRKKFGWVELEKNELLPGGGSRYQTCVQEERCVTNYAKFKPDEDISESIVAFFIDPEILDPEKYEFLKEHLCCKSPDETQEKINISPNNTIKLPMIDKPIKYERTFKTFKLGSEQNIFS